MIEIIEFGMVEVTEIDDVILFDIKDFVFSGCDETEAKAYVMKVIRDAATNEIIRLEGSDLNGFKME